MAASGQITITGTIIGLPTGSKDLGTQTISNAAAVGTTTDVALSIGNNTINVPTGSVAALIVPAVANTATLVLKGVAGDTGITIGKTSPFVLTLASTQTTFVLNASAITSAEVLFL